MLEILLSPKVAQCAINLTISNRTGLEPVSALNFLLGDFMRNHTSLLFQTLVHDFSLLLLNRKDSED